MPADCRKLVSGIPQHRSVHTHLNALILVCIYVCFSCCTFHVVNLYSLISQSHLVDASYIVNSYLGRHIFLITLAQSMKRSWVSSVSIVSDYRQYDGFDPQQRQRIFPLAFVSRSALRPTQPRIQWAPEVLCWG
jgi:hypothetical protein